MTQDRLPSDQLPPGGAAPLTHWGLIQVDGEDAAKFLHGQLTQDIVLLGEQEARLAGYCSVKGRLLASFIAWKPAPDRVMLACSTDVLAATLKRLSMFVLRAKARLTDASASHRLLGLSGQVAHAWLGERAPKAVWGRHALGNASVIRLPDALGQPRYLWCAPADAGADADPLAALPSLDAAAWQWLEVESGVPFISQPTADQFVPQMINFEALGGVSFKKGCFPGQEVVARSQYRGTIKRRGFLLQADAPAAPGQEIFHSADPEQPCGMVVNAAAQPGAAARWSVFAELKLAATEGGSLHLGSASGPALQLQALPYSLPTEA